MVGQAGLQLALLLEGLLQVERLRTSQAALQEILHILVVEQLVFMELRIHLQVVVVPEWAVQAREIFRAALWVMATTLLVFPAPALRLQCLNEYCCQSVEVAAYREAALLSVPQTLVQANRAAAVKAYPRELLLIPAMVVFLLVVVAAAQLNRCMAAKEVRWAGAAGPLQTQHTTAEMAVQVV